MPLQLISLILLPTRIQIQLQVLQLAPPSLTGTLVNISANCVQCYSNVMGHTSAANYLNCQVKSPAIGVSNVYGAATM